MQTTLLAALIASSAPAHAQCGYSVSFFHGYGGSWEGFDESTIETEVFVLDDPTVYLERDNFLCTSASSTPPGCAGTATDGIVTINGNWGNPGAVDCPSSTPSWTGGNAGDAPAVVYAVSIADEGTVDHSGNYIIGAVGYHMIIGGYVVDTIDPSYFKTSIAAHTSPLPRLVINHGDGTFAVEWDAAITMDDCQAAATGASIVTCPSGAPSRDLSVGYQLYRIDAPCDAPPTTGRVSGWSLESEIAPGDPLEATVALGAEECSYFAVEIAVADHPTTIVGAHLQLDIDSVVEPEPEEPEPTDTGTPEVSDTDEEEPEPSEDTGEEEIPVDSGEDSDPPPEVGEDSGEASSDTDSEDGSASDTAEDSDGSAFGTPEDGDKQSGCGCASPVSAAGMGAIFCGLGLAGLRRSPRKGRPLER